MPQCVTLSLFRFDRMRDRLWAFGQMGLSRRALARTPGLRFWKLCGSGIGEGFTPIPNTAVWAILGAWENDAAARRACACAEGRVHQRFRRHASEDWTVMLRPASARGHWSGTRPFAPETADAPAAGPIAALTRATLRPRDLHRFWARSPDISAAIGRDPNVIFKIGIGEVPWLQQVTFSIWPDAAAMAAFARRGPHADAISAVRAGGWFAEELYARFSILDDMGSWGGGSPLARLEAA